MTTTKALLKNTTLFLVVYAGVSLLAAKLLLKFDTLNDFFLAWVAAMGVLAPVGGFALFMLVWWTIASHGQPAIQTEYSGSSSLDVDTSPQVSTGGHILVDGRDPSGNLFGGSND